MQKFADYIKRIEIDSLWSGKKHIIWTLDPHVNILSGINGQGKSTIINKVVKGLSQGGEFPSHMLIFDLQLIDFCPASETLPVWRSRQR